jgi:hypothetical protein
VNDNHFPPAWYDTEDGIKSALDRDLAGFHDLIQARRGASDAGQRLRRRVVARRFRLDTNGSTWTLETEAYGLPRVSPGVENLGTACGVAIAPAGVMCERCGRAWTLSDAHDYRRVRADDDSPQHHYHTGCHHLKVAAETRVELTKVMRDAGIEQKLLDVPNLYGSDNYAGPWFTTITTQLGRVTIGWRERVIAIEWERGPDGREVFADESVTVDRGLVHAWSGADATQYLRRLLEVAS